MAREHAVDLIDGSGYASCAGTLFKVDPYENIRMESEPRKMMRWAGTMKKIYNFLMEEQEIANKLDTK